MLCYWIQHLFYCLCFPSLHAKPWYYNDLSRKFPISLEKKGEAVVAELSVKCIQQLFITSHHASLKGLIQTLLMCGSFFFLTGNDAYQLIMCWTDAMTYYWHYDGLLQDCSISIALAMEILLSCTKPSISILSNFFNNSHQLFCFLFKKCFYWSL